MLNRFFPGEAAAHLTLHGAREGLVRDLPGTTLIGFNRVFVCKAAAIFFFLSGDKRVFEIVKSEE